MNLTDTNDPPVTVDVIRQAKLGCEAEFELALTDIIAAAEGFDGHLGTNIFRLMMAVMLNIALFSNSTTSVH